MPCLWADDDDKHANINNNTKSSSSDHMLNLPQTLNVTRVESGPSTLVLRENELLVGSVRPMITIPPAHYAVITNPFLYVRQCVVLRACAWLYA